MGETRNDPSSVHCPTSRGYFLKHFGQYFCILHTHLQRVSTVAQTGALGKEFVGSIETSSSRPLNTPENQRECGAESPQT